MKFIRADLLVVVAVIVFKLARYIIEPGV